MYTSLLLHLHHGDAAVQVNNIVLKNALPFFNVIYYVILWFESISFRDAPFLSYLRYYADSNVASESPMVTTIFKYYIISCIFLYFHFS